MTFNAKEIAEKIFLTRGMFLDNKIEDALNEAHSAGVKEGRDKTIEEKLTWVAREIDKAYERGLAQGRAEENEACAKVAEKMCTCAWHIAIGYEIRMRMIGKEKSE